MEQPEPYREALALGVVCRDADHTRSPSKPTLFGVSRWESLGIFPRMGNLFDMWREEGKIEGGVLSWNEDLGSILQRSNSNSRHHH